MKSSSHIISTILRIPAVLISVFLLFSCGGGDDDDLVIWDFVNVNVMIQVQDASGKNLLSPSVAGNLQGKKIYLDYDGEEYELNWDAEEASRFNMPFFRGLTIRAPHYYSDGEHYVADHSKNYLSFGEFDGSKNQNVTVILHIDGYSESWEVTVNHTVKWENKKPVVTNAATLNGKDTPYDGIVITL